MSKVSITRSLLDDLAMSISAKSGEPVPMTLTEMKDAVDGISGGGTTIDPLSVTANGTYTAQSGHAYSPVTVNVPTPSLQSKTYTVDSAGTETVTADSGYDGLSSVSVSVPNYSFGVHSDSIEVDSEDWLLTRTYPNQTSGYLSEIDGFYVNLDVENKTVNPSASSQIVTPTDETCYLNSVTVNAIPTDYVGTGITRRSSSDLTASGATVTVPSGYYSAQASKAIASGTAGTPTATKGTVSNHSVSVTPSVTNTSGYISGGTISGTAVTVSASELVSGSETKTENGTYDVTNLAELVVDVSGGGTSWQTLYDGSVQVYSSSPNYFQTSPYTTAFQSGQTYRVTWGQTQYLCNTITDPLGATYDGWLIGNLSIVGAGTDTGEPFIIYRNSVTELTGGTTSSTGTHSIKIELQQGGGINLQNKTVTPTTSQQTVQADNGYDGLDTVTVNAMPSGTAGTPTATKGTVSNHSISVTPSVTNTTGYITGGTKTGTAVTVTASELVSGTYTVSASGTHDVTNYASASVASGSATASATKGTVSNHSVTVTPSVTRTAGYITAGSANGTAVTVSASELVSGSETKTANGTYDVTNLASLVVDIDFVTYYTGTTVPSTLADGDIFLKVVS